MKESEASHPAGAPTQLSQNPASAPSNSSAFTTTLSDLAAGTVPLRTLRYPMRINLDHLGKEGQTAIDAREVERIKSIILREVELVLAGGFHRRIIITADNICESTPLCGQWKSPIPEDAILVRAVFDIVFAGSTTRCRVEIRPPNVVLVTESAHIPSITHWLALVCVRAANRVAHKALIALLALTTAFSPVLDDDADDDDGDWHHAHAALRA
jgi:hypothetical protein